jgi:hypothetical protein
MDKTSSWWLKLTGFMQLLGMSEQIGAVEVLCADMPWHSPIQSPSAMGQLACRRWKIQANLAHNRGAAHILKMKDKDCPSENKGRRRRKETHDFLVMHRVQHS